MPGPERTFRVVAVTCPTTSAGEHWITALAVREPQEAVMVTEGVPTPAYTLVTVPSEETVATVASLVLQVMVPVPPVREALSCRVWVEARVYSVTSRVSAASGSRLTSGSESGSSGVLSGEVVSSR